MQRFRTEEQFSVLWSQYQLARQFPTLLFEYSSEDLVKIWATRMNQTTAGCNKLHPKLRPKFKA